MKPICPDELTGSGSAGGSLAYYAFRTGRTTTRRSAEGSMSERP